MTTPVTIEDIYKLFQKSQEESDRRFAERDRRISELNEKLTTIDRLVDCNISQAVNNSTTREKCFVADIVQPAIWHIFHKWGIDIKELALGVRTERHGLEMQIDILAINDDQILLVEYTPKFSKSDVDEFVEKLTRFKDAFPHYKDYQTYGAVAGIEINEGIDRYAYRQGLFVIKPSGDGVAIANDDDFKPTTW
jgi:hypothetical protein